ncbi:hypothetical protein ZIOFF_045714 [Zingiber officinale]|uniref:Uncharacterized protein n=1 Tax=Zingiber officinale TaxID=94328 RepID=A0A8J5FZ24_ZINOF|nr:hypothetical protein ZIOFF_045714 [Zingiber officinale]
MAGFYRDDFRNYAETCFRNFGDRVKHWITFNEPWSYSIGGYGLGFLAPGRCSNWEEQRCSHGDSSKEPYIVAHHQLLERIQITMEKIVATENLGSVSPSPDFASALDLEHPCKEIGELSKKKGSDLKEKLSRAIEKFGNRYVEVDVEDIMDMMGKIGITLVSNWMIPYSNSKSNREATDRALDFMYGWFMDPLTKGDYPLSMRVNVGNRLPKFTKKQSKMVKGSYDFIGVNYYTARYIYELPRYHNVHKSYNTDSCTNSTVEKEDLNEFALLVWIRILPLDAQNILRF